MSKYPSLSSGPTGLQTCIMWLSCMRPNNFGEPTCMQLHHFSDASEYGYGTATYLRMENKENQVSLAFILGKARVAHLKQTTIPRLELTVAVLAARLDKMLRRELHLDLQPSVFWTDSTTVSKYIANETRRFHTFVANRVAVIRELTSVAQWRYVSTKLNLADEASRGLSAEEFLACERWLKGPPFLLKGEEEWPTTIPDQPLVFVDDPEVKREPLKEILDNSNSACRKVISECTECRRFQGNMGQQKMADLPEERVVPDLPAFANVGVDYFGPVEVKKGQGRVKRYGVLFTCVASRAVHLEVAYALDNDSCINAIGRFTCRRGQISHLISDNGTNFIGAERELREAVSNLDHFVKEHAGSCCGPTWSFNPPAGTHYGGVWERLIRLVKRVLASTLRLQTLDDEGFHTVLCEIEAILNSRPITKASDVDDLEALTPNHLLLLKTKTKPLLPPGLFQRDDLYLKRW
ncbi:hypothetical protein SRHO_G00289930 [Serrasalmus rhombeus]